MKKFCLGLFAAFYLWMAVETFLTIAAHECGVVRPSVPAKVAAAAIWPLVVIIHGSSKIIFDHTMTWKCTGIK